MLSKEADQIQSEVFKNLINALMLPQGIQINNLNELNQGTVLPKFTQILLNEEIQGWKDIPDAWKNKPIFKQRILSQVSANLSTIIKHLATKDNAFKFMKAPESEKDLIAFLWLLISKFYIVQPKRNLVNQIAQQLKDHASALDIKNMSSSWENGLPFIALLSKASNGTIEYSDKGNAQSNYNYIKESCQSLNIPFILTEKCISSKPDENCICIQAAIILKSMDGVETPVQQSTSNEQDEKKKFEEKIDDYKKKLQNAIDAIDSEQVQIKKLSNCFSSADIDYKRKYIHDFQSSKKKIYLDNYYIIRDSWAILDRNSNRTKIPIPSDLMKAEEIKQKIDHLEEMLKLQNDNLNSDEIKLKQLNDEINSITTLNQAREKFNELKDKINMDNWENLSHNHIAYILGKKLQTYESDLKNAVEKYEDKQKNFESIRNQIITEIENNSDDLIGLEKSLKTLDDAFYGVKNAFKSIQKIDDSTSITFSEEELKSKIDSVKKLLDENKSNLSKISFDKELDSITKKYEIAINEIQKFDEYKNVYSSSLKNTAKSEHPIEIPKYYKLELLVKEMGDNEEYLQKYEEIKKLIDSAQSSYDFAIMFLNSREIESETIESKSKFTKQKCQEFNGDNLQRKIVVLGEVREQVLEVENLKKWDDDAKGSTIDIYNECMKEAKEILQNGTKIIEDKFNEYLAQVKETLKRVKEDKMKQTKQYKEDLINHKVGFTLIKGIIEKLSVLKLTNEKMNFNRDSELDEIQNESDKTKENLQKLVDNFGDRMKEVVDSEIKRISSINENEYIDQLKSDSSNINDLDVELIDKKGSEYLSTYVNILETKSFIDEYKSKDQECEISSITSLLHDLIIIYKSTLLLNPKQCTSDLKKRCEKCTDSNFSLSMALLYAHKFNNNNKYEIEDISEAKDEIESSVDSSKDFNVSISKQICKRANDNSLSNQIELNILCDFLEFMPDYEDNLKNYLTTSIGNSPDLISMKNKLEQMNQIQPKLIEIFKASIEKINSNVKAKLCETPKDISGQDISTIIADFGSYETRIGIEGETEPRDIVPTVVAVNNTMMSLTGKPVKRVGERAYYSTSGFRVEHPIQQGIVTNWDDMESILNHTIGELSVSDLTQHPLLCNEPINTPKANREKWIQVIFETFRLPSYCCVNSNCLSLYSTGRTTGLVIDCGYDRTTFAPIFDGFSIPSHTNVQPYGGKDVTELLLKEIGRNHEMLKSSSSIDIVERIKRSKCYVAIDFELEKNKYLCENYYLSDGQFVSIHEEMINSTEYLFDPSIGFKNYDGIPKTIFDTIMNIDIDYRNLLASNIFITGGNSRLNGFVNRVEKEMSQMESKSLSFDYIRPEKEKYPTWIGASILSTLPYFPQMLITRQEYDGQGPGIVHRKCIY